MPDHEWQLAGMSVCKGRRANEMHLFHPCISSCPCLLGHSFVCKGYTRIITSCYMGHITHTNECSLQMQHCKYSCSCTVHLPMMSVLICTNAYMHAYVNTPTYIRTYIHCIKHFGIEFHVERIPVHPGMLKSAMENLLKSQPPCASDAQPTINTECPRGAGCLSQRGGFCSWRCFCSSHCGPACGRCRSCGNRDTLSRGRRAETRKKGTGTKGLNFGTVKIFLFF